MAKRVTFGEAADRIRKVRERLLLNVPQAPIDAAHKTLQAELPLYTGTYRDAVEIRADLQQDRAIFQLFVNEGTLRASAAQHEVDIAEGGRPGRGVSDPLSPEDYIFGQARPTKTKRRYRIDSGSEPYIKRIEATGPPKSDQGQNAWALATATAGVVFQRAVKKAVKT